MHQSIFFVCWIMSQLSLFWVFWINDASAESCNFFRFRGFPLAQDACMGLNHDDGSSGSYKFTCEGNEGYVTKYGDVECSTDPIKNNLNETKHTFTCSSHNNTCKHFTIYQTLYANDETCSSIGTPSFVLTVIDRLDCVKIATSNLWEKFELSNWAMSLDLYWSLSDFDDNQCQKRSRGILHGYPPMVTANKCTSYPGIDGSLVHTIEEGNSKSNKQFLIKKGTGATQSPQSSPSSATKLNKPLSIVITMFAVVTTMDVLCLFKRW